MLPGYINQQESMAASEPVMTIDEANSCQVVFTHVKPYHRLLLKAGKLIYSVSLHGTLVFLRKEQVLINEQGIK